MIQTIGTICQEVLVAFWGIMLDAAVYIIIGLLAGGLLKVFLTPATVAAHLGRGRIRPVFKAALFGIPIPLCSCSVLPAAVSLKKQGANNGATMAFLISTPESGVDSISLSWALLDPVMTIVRPLAAFLSAFTAGVVENIRGGTQAQTEVKPDLSCPVDSCCDGIDCAPEEHRRHHSPGEKFLRGIRYAMTDLWGDIAGSFFVGVLLAGIVYAIVPDDMLGSYLGGGLHAMLIMLVAGIPLYICATASTPIAAALILKGVSPGAALVFLLVGPATNIMSVSVLVNLLGKRSTAIYLISISIVSVLCGWGLDLFYRLNGLSAKATIGRATEIIPIWMKEVAAVTLIVLSIPLVIRYFRKNSGAENSGCGCTDASCAADCGKPAAGENGLVQLHDIRKRPGK